MRLLWENNCPTASASSHESLKGPGERTGGRRNYLFRKVVKWYVKESKIIIRKCYWIYDIFFHFFFIMILVCYYVWSCRLHACYAFVYGGVSSLWSMVNKIRIIDFIYVHVFVAGSPQRIRVLVTTYEGPFLFFFSLVFILRSLIFILWAGNKF